jgi:hypothetical protein
MGIARSEFSGNGSQFFSAAHAFGRPAFKAGKATR